MRRRTFHHWSNESVTRIAQYEEHHGKYLGWAETGPGKAKGIEAETETAMRQKVSHLMRRAGFVPAEEWT